MSNNLSINPSETEKQIVSFIKETAGRTGFSRMVLGLSGGIDSAVVCCLAVSALGNKNVLPILLPYGKLNEKAKEDARLVIESLQIPSSNITTLDIQKIVDQFVGSDFGTDKLRKGNVIARVRMTCLFDLAKKYRALVLGTENKTENLLGYYTRFGDSASDIEPLVHLYKTQVRQLAAYLKIPEKIISNIPTAGLWQGQTDEGEFGFSYDLADRILFYFFDRKLKEEEIIKKGISEETVNKVLERFKANSFKHKLPFSL